MPGWIDGVSGVATAAWPFAIGLKRLIYLTNSELDFIPGDFCSNSILVTTAYIASLLGP